MKRVLNTVIFFLLLSGVWAALTGDLLRWGIGPEEPLWSPYVLPPPSVVGQYLWDNTLNGKIPLSMLITLRRLLIGYVIGLVLGVPLGMLAARFRWASDTIGVLALGLQALPSVCWVPLACIWFGQTEAALLFVVIMGTLWSVLLSTQNGMKNVPPIYARAARTMGAGPLKTLVSDAYARRTASAVHSRQDGYEDEAYTVVSDEEVMRRWQRTEESAARARHTQEPSIDENADVSDVIRAGYSAMRRIREANDIIKDEALSAQIDSIENSCSQILSILEQRPNLLAQLRTFLRYYLPTTLRLLEARAKLENSANTRKAREIRTRISEAVGVIDKAFLKQLEALDAYRFLDLESEMDVLRDMLKADGLINEDSEADDPFASVMGSH